MLAILSKQWSGVAGLLPAFPRNIKVVCWACVLGFPGGSVVKNLPANAGDTGSIPDRAGSHMRQNN